MSTALDNYMKQEKVSDADLSATIGRDRSIVSRLRRGKITPTLEIAAAIEKATKGHVTMASWVKRSTRPTAKAGVA